MSNSKKNKRMERDKMNAVLSIDSYRSVSTPTKNDFNEPKTCGNGKKKEMDIKKLVELESRYSSADEFPLLWNGKEE